MKLNTLLLGITAHNTHVTKKLAKKQYKEAQAEKRATRIEENIKVLENQTEEEKNKQKKAERFLIKCLAWIFGITIWFVSLVCAPAFVLPATIFIIVVRVIQKKHKKRLTK